MVVDGDGYRCAGGVPCTHAHACMYMHAHTHAHTCMLNMINMDTFMLVAICNFYTCVMAAGSFTVPPQGFP